MHNESKPFSNDTEYKLFIYNWCMLCIHYKLRNDGFPELAENGGCPVLDAMERERFDTNVFLRNVIEEQDENGNIVHKCARFEHI